MISDGPIADGTIDSLAPQAANPVQGAFSFGIDCNCCRPHGCDDCPVTICVSGCIEPAFLGGPTIGPLSGVAVQVKNGAAVIASGTTGADGCVTLTIVNNPGTYHWEATKSGYISITNGPVPGCCGAIIRCMDLDDTTKTCDASCGPSPATVNITESGFPTASMGTLHAFGHRCDGSQTKWKGELPAGFVPLRHYELDTTGGFVRDPFPGGFCVGDVCTLIVDFYSCDPLMIVLKPPPDPLYGEEGCNCLFRGALAADPVITITE